MRHFNREVCVLLGLLVIYFSLLFASFAHADGSFTATWKAPTERVDGTALPTEEIATYELYSSATESAENAELVVSLPNHAFTFFRPNTIPEGACYWFAIRVIDTAGNASEFSESVVKCNITLADPKPPTDFAGS